MATRGESFQDYVARAKKFGLGESWWNMNDWAISYGKDEFAPMQMALGGEKRKRDDEIQTSSKKSNWDAFLLAYRANPSAAIGTSTLDLLLKKYGITYAEFTPWYEGEVRKANIANENPGDRWDAFMIAWQNAGQPKNGSAEFKKLQVDYNIPDSVVESKSQLVMIPYILHAAELNWEFTKTIREKDPLHWQSYHEGAGGSLICDEKPEEAWNKCYYEWWTPEIIAYYIAKWKVKYPLTRHEMFMELNANVNFPWRAINGFWAQVPDVDTKVGANVGTDYYYDYKVPYAGVVYDWYNTTTFQIGSTQKAELWTRFNSIVQTLVGGEIGANNFSNAVKDEKKQILEDLSSPKLFIVALGILAVMGLAGGAALVSEIKK